MILSIVKKRGRKKGYDNNKQNIIVYQSNGFRESRYMTYLGGKIA